MCCKSLSIIRLSKTDARYRDSRTHPLHKRTLERYKSDIGNFLRRVLKYNSFNVNYAQMAGIEKNYKGHSGVSRSRAAPRHTTRRIKTRAYGSNDIAVLVASRRVAIIAEQVFLPVLFPDASNVEQNAPIASVYLHATETSSGPPLPFYPSAGRLFHGAGPPCSPVFIVWCIAKP